MNQQIEEHYKANRNKYVKMFRSRCGDSAEDVVQTAYERCLKYSDSFNGEDFSKWFSMILRNCVRDHIREEMGRPEQENLDEFDHVGASCSGEVNASWKSIYKRIKKLPPKQAEVLMLYFQKGYSYNDIKNVTSSTYFAAYQLINRFKKDLQKEFEK